MNEQIEYVRDTQIRANTCQDMADYFAWQVNLGRGKCVVQADRRGLGFLLMYLAEKLAGMINIVTPPDGETYDPKRGVVYVSVRF